MIEKGTKLSGSKGFLATLMSISVMGFIFSAGILIEDTEFTAEKGMEAAIGEMIGFLFLIIFFFGLPVSLVVALIVRAYSATIMRRFNLPMPVVLLIGATLGSLGTGIFSLAGSWIMWPLGFFVGLLAAYSFYVQQKGSWH